MTYTFISITDFLSNTQSPSKEELELFSKHRDRFLRTNENESEEHQKIALIDFLSQSFAYVCNTNKRIDLSIYEDSKAKVLFEVKSLSNKSEFIKGNNLESKAFYESILYFLREYKTHNNNNLKYIILTNTRDFYLIDAREYLQFAKDKTILKAFDNCEKGQGVNTSTSKFYTTLKDYLPTLNSTLEFTHFNIQTTPLPLLYQALSPQVLLKRKTYIDANTLNQSFYDELLYILGLKEIDQKGKILILPTTEPNTLLDSIANAFQLSSQDDFETIFSLLTTWNNRILFLRLLESMLLSFKHIDKPFLDIAILKNFTDLNTLFFEILAIRENKRQSTLKELDSIPYLNSSLFDKTELEREGKEIKFLDSKTIAIFKHSILKKDKDYKDTKSLPLLEYLFRFLHAYDFTTTPKDIQDNVKINHDKLINAAVLGLVFEKLNGYKEGSFYTPSFITSYMCKESLEKIVIDKFNTAFKSDAKTINELPRIARDENKTIQDLRTILFSIKICDPAVGSGHFLVSALNELVFIAYRLGILESLDFQTTLELDNEEIIIKKQGKILEYTKPNDKDEPQHKIQQELFNLKKEIIESCLFGVDINPNSCEITKLRLWIELLKYSFYLFDSNGKNTNTLETLPNIDINIKCGNSLISRFDLQDSLNINNIEQEIQTYKNLVIDYKHNKDIATKQKIQESIKNLKEKFKISIKANKEQDKLRKGIEKHLKIFGTFALGEWINETTFIFKENMDSGIGVVSNILTNKDYAKSFEPTESSKKQEAFKSASKLIELRMQIDDKLNAKGYEKAFEWRFEFPEVLSDGLTKEQIAFNNQLKQKGISDKEFEKQKFHSNAGDFLGFDLVIGNPPYIRQEEIKHLKPHLQKAFRIYKGTSDIYTYFFEQGHKILKPNGILSFITSNKYCRAGYGEPLREFLLEATALLYYIELNGVKVFDSASVDTSILSFAKIDKSKGAKLDSTHTFDYAHPKDYDTNSNVPLQEHITLQSLLQSSLSKESFIFQDSTNAALKAKIEKIGTPLKEWDISIYRGILTGYNEAFIIDSAKRDEILNNCKDKSERERTSKLIKKMLRDRDIKRYGYEWAGLWLICTFPSLNLDIEKYPSLKAYLESFRPRIDQSGEKGCRKKTSNKWFETQDNIAYHEEFEKEKVVYPTIMANTARFIFDKTSLVCDTTGNIIVCDCSQTLRYVLAIQLSKFWYISMKMFYMGGGINNEFKVNNILKFPIPKIDSTNKALSDEIISLVEQILESKAKDPTTDTKELESKIDSLVYKLYHLTNDEIKIIENKE